MNLISNLMILFCLDFKLAQSKNFHKYLHVTIVVATNTLLALKTNDTIQYE